MPALSVLMPAYNSISTLEKAVASVQWQTFKDWELVIVDDGSSDDTLVLARRLASADPRIRVIAAAHTGRGGARNAAIEAARAGLMIHCDSDDVYFPNAFEKVVARMSGDDEVDLLANQSIYIPVETLHRLENRTDEDIHLIEVQCGDYFGEDDIERFEDRYGRV